MFTRAIGTFNEFFLIRFQFYLDIYSLLLCSTYHIIWFWPKKMHHKECINVSWNLWSLFTFWKIKYKFHIFKGIPTNIDYYFTWKVPWTSLWYIIHNHENQSFITKFLCQVYTTLVSAKAWFYTNWLNPVFFTSFIMLMKIQS